MNRARRFGLIVLLVLVVLAIGYGFWPKPILIDAVQVTRGPLTVTVEEEGKTRVIDRFVISTPVAGFARRVELDIGDSVMRGQVLVELEPLPSTVLDPRSRAEAQARVAAAQASLLAAEQTGKAAEAEANYAAAELERVRLLYEADNASREELDQAVSRAQQMKANRRSSKFAVQVARFELEAARTTLRHSAARHTGKPAEKVAISAPVNGHVLKIHRESEGVVEAGHALLEIGDPRALEVEIDVLSADAVRIKAGTRVLFKHWGGSAPLTGRVRVVEPVGFTKISALGVEEQRVLVIADITSQPEAWEPLGDGYRVEASFILWEGKDVLQVPASALSRHAEGWAVLVIKGRKARRQSVAVGRRNGLAAEILSGLSVSEMVVAHPGHSIDDGTRVRVR
ncbi:MAG: efflux RND transporter periplasmic adaptor subunit [Gammaproteobacteria bacterium]|nr:efflux RND transporter periplasmic adaptor subunit [Gammaproteobacteria bacterium]